MLHVYGNKAHNEQAERLRMDYHRAARRIIKTAIEMTCASEMLPAPAFHPVLWRDAEVTEVGVKCT